MNKFALALLVVIAGAVPASAADMPARKAGLWEMKTTLSSGHVVSLQQCVDAKTDETMQANAAAGTQHDCSKRDVHKSGNTITIDSVCVMAGKPRAAHTVVTGNFDSAYDMTITREAEDGSKRVINTEAKWLGPCAADQKPGDTIMPNGTRVNVLEMTGPGGAPAAPAAPQH
jgi:hypothetical protein